MTDGLIHDRRQLAFPFSRETKLVAFWSPAPQSGKTTAATLLAKEIDADRVAFADPLREAAFALACALGEDSVAAHRAIFGGIGKEDPLPVLGKSAVEWFMLIGTKVGREWLDPEFWVTRATKTIQTILDDDVPVVVDDVRFPNERDAIRRLGGVLIGIRRPGATISEARRAAEGLLTFEDMDAVIDNDGSIEQFQERVRRTVVALGFSI